MAEAEHRIANNLTLIAALIRSTSDAIAADPEHRDGMCALVLRDVSAKIDSVGRLHRLLIDHPTRPYVVLSEYLREVADAAVSALAGDYECKVSFCDEVKRPIPAKEAAAIGMFVGEAITNAIKHSHGPDVCIGSELKEGTLIVQVVDNGPGLSEGSARPGRGGFRLMYALAAQLGGQLELESSHTGLRVALSIPAREDPSDPPEKTQG